MSTLRPECITSNKTPITKSEAFRRIYRSVRKRRSLGYGKLDTADGKHCAMGCLWDDNPTLIIPSDVTDAVAAVNDSVPPTATASERRRHVLRWLEWKLEAMGIRV